MADLVIDGQTIEAIVMPNGEELELGKTPTLQSKSVSYTPTETAQSQTITPDSGYDGLDEVSVSVGAISSTHVGSGITRRSSTDLSASGATVSVPSGYYANNASKAVASGTAGTPTASKGSVSNHSVSVTPSVTNTTGYITGSTKTGTAVTVSASELVSGTVNIISSGNTDVTNYATAFVASGGATASATKGTVSNHSISVTPSVTKTAGYITAGTTSGTAVTVSASELVSGSETKTANGTYDVTNLAELVVNVSGGGSSDVVMGTLTVASNINTSTSTKITDTTAIGFTPTKFFFWKDSRTATSNHLHQATFTTIGSYYIRTMTRYSSNALSTSGNTNSWTTQTAGYLYYNSNTIYIRSSSSYILSSGTWYWVAVK